MIRTPKIGDRILYVLANGQARPGVVVNYFGADRVNATVFPDALNDSFQEGEVRVRYETTLPVGSARYGETGEIGTWRFQDEG